MPEIEQALRISIGLEDPYPQVKVRKWVKHK